MTITMYRCQVSIPLYGDFDHNASNTLYFGGGPSTNRAQDILEIADRVNRFYTYIDGGIYPSTIVGTPATVTMYDMADPQPRAPIFVGNMTITPSGTAAYPSDVCIALSYRADFPSGANRARRRGRIFLGPVTTATAVAVAGQGMRVAPAAITTILDGAEQLSVEGLTPITWSMFSETDGVGRTIVEMSIDNQFDTRRSRDNPTSVRTARPVP